jgi:hypothetical protein
MILDPSEYEVCIKLPVYTQFTSLVTFSRWAKENNIPIGLSFGNIYFKDEHAATLFRLKFGL